MSQPSANPSEESFTLTEMPDIDKVHSLIKAMYEQSELKDFASKWLAGLQKSIYAWQISDQLLIKRIDFQSCYFAAQTLKTKTQHNFYELPKESCEEFKNSLINHLINMDERTIQTQLCLAITYVFYFNDSWENPIEELSTKIHKNKFLDLLICIAQEYDDSRPIMKLPKTRRDKIEAYLSQRFLHVMQLCTTSLQESMTMDLRFQKQIAGSYFDCFEAWVIFAKADHLQIIESILETTFNYLKNPSCEDVVHEKATEALCKVIYQCEARSIFSDLRVYVLEQVYQLDTAFQLAITREDSEKLINFAKIFTELGNSTLDFIVYDQVDTRILQLILNCVAHFDFEVAATTFTFWYSFSDSVFRHNSQQFVPFLNLLLTSLTRHCQMDSDHEGLIDDTSDLFDVRSQIMDLVREIIICVDWAAYLQSMKIVDSLKTSTSVELIEVNLHMIYCIVSNKENIQYNNNKDSVLREIVEYILSIITQPTHAQVIATCCNILGELDQWLNEHPTLLQSSIQVLLQIIRVNYKPNPALSSISSTAMKQIVSSSSASIDFESITSLFVNLINIYSLIEDVSVNLSVSILACCTAIVSNENVVKNDQQELLVQQLIQLCWKKIQDLDNCKPNTDEYKRKWEKIIDNIYAIFKKFRPNEKTRTSEVIHKLILENIWPFLRESITHFSSIDSQVIEHCSRCIRHIVRSLKPSYLLQPIADHIVPLYQKYPMNSSLLYVGSVLVDEFANKDNPYLTNGLIQMLNTFSLSTFQFLNEANMNKHPYTIDDFFNLSTRMMKRLTESFLSNIDTLNNILNLVLIAVYLDQKEANDSVNGFIEEFLKIDHPLVKQYIGDIYGQKLLFAILDSALFKLPSYFIQDVVSTIWTFKNFEPNVFRQSLQYSVSELYNKAQSQGCQVTREDLQNFYESVERASNPKRLVSEIRSLQRLLI